MLSSITKKELREQIKRLHEGPFMVCMASAGATGEMLQSLWNVSGSSDTIIDGTFLSHRRRTMKFLNVRKVDEHAFRFCSDETALRLAAECYMRGREAIEEDGVERPIIGIGMTATCRTSRPQKGAHRVHIALRTAEGSHVIHAEFDKELLDRETQGSFCDLLALNALLKLTECGGWDFMEPGVMYPSAIEASGRILRRHQGYGGTWISAVPMSFHDSSGNAVQCFRSDAVLDPARDLIFPGSFNPLHHGHLGCAKLAADMTEKRVVFQLTAVHPDKGIIDDATLLKRADQFAYRDPVLLMREGALYVEKAKLLPGFSFLIGADAAYGLLNPKYYDGQQGLLDMLEELRRLKTTFYVMGRVVEGKYRTVNDIPIPRKYLDLFQQVSGRYDVSSTERRTIAAAAKT